MDDQTEAEKIRMTLKQTRGTREYARVVAVNMVRVNRQSPIFAAEMLGVDRGIVSDWPDAYDRKGPDGLADDARPGHPPFVPRGKLKKIIGGAKRLTAYEFVELVKKRTSVYSPEISSLFKT